MRIALIAPPWAPVPPMLYGGTEQAVDSLAQGFQRAGHDVLLFTTGDSTCPVPRRSVLDASEGQRIGQVVPELRHVMGAYDAVRGYDIVHDHTVAGPVLAPHLPGAPRVVTTVHGPLDGELADVYRQVTASVPLIAISEAQRRPAPDIPVARVIHHGVNPELFPVGDGGAYCLFLGRISRDKGPHRAIAAARRAGMPIVLAGKMREPAELLYFERLVAPLLDDDVTYLGEVSYEEKVRLLAGARATLFPIRWNEPFGLVMLESLACGTPVIAFPEGAAPEVIDHGRTGFLCQDEDEMVEAIAKADIIDRRDCRAVVEGYFSVDRMVSDHLQLFEQLIESHPGGGSMKQSR